MLSVLPQPRPKHRPALGAMPLLVALLLAMLQAATPFAHAMVHLAAAVQAGAVAPVHHDGPAWNSADAEEKPCALCAADHLPALPEAATAATPPGTARTDTRSLPVSTLSSAPLDLFCRPPPFAV